MRNNTEGTISREIADKKKIVREASFEASNLIGHHLFWVDDTWRHWLMSTSTGGHASHFSLKERGAESPKQDSSRTIHNSAPRKPGLMDCWWVWMLWWMSGGQREPAERSIVLRWPVKNSIIPPSHLWLTPFLPLRQATLSSEKYHRNKLAESPDSITGLYRNTSHSHLWLSAKSLQCWCRSQFGSSLFGLISKPQLRLQMRLFTEWEIVWQRINAIAGLIYMISYRQICAADFWWNKTRSDNDTDWIPYITPSVRHPCKHAVRQQTAITFCTPGSRQKSSNTSPSQNAPSGQEGPQRQNGPEAFLLLTHLKRSADIEWLLTGCELH